MSFLSSAQLRTAGFALTLAGSLLAAPPLRADAPRTCLVLSGGGARGFAHVGVLKALEEHGVQIDCITGTSMGAIVGGLYASGKSAADLERLVLGLDWEAMFSERPPRQELSLRRKEEDFRFPLPFEIGLRDWKFGLPRGAFATSHLELELKALTAQLPEDLAFDRLPIPFRAVATDLESGAIKVFERGPLRTAMRASMSVPGAFAPTEVKGRLYGDGGLVKNLPVDLAHELGATRVIAVNIGTPLAPREELGSFVGVTRQMINILTEQNVREQLTRLDAARDLLISPELGDIGATDFTRGAAAIAAGYAAVQAARQRLVEFAATGPQRIATPPAAPVDPERIDFVDFRPLEFADPEVLAATMDTRPGQAFDRATLHADLARLQGRGDFERLDYSLVTERDRKGVLIEATEKSWGPNYLRFSLTASTDFRGDGSFNLRLGHVRTWVNRLGAEWRNEVQIGRTRRLRSEFYQPLSAANWLYADAHFEHERRLLDVFAAGERVAQFDLATSRFGLDLGAPIGKWGEGRLGLTLAHISAEPSVSIFPVTYSAREAGYTAAIVYDQLDSVSFPRDGSRVKLSILAATKTLGSDASYLQAQIEAQKAFTVGVNTVNLALLAGGYGADDKTGGIGFSLGGFQQLSGFRNDEFRGNYVFLVRAAAYRQVGQLPAFGRAVYLGGSLEAGNVWATRHERRQLRTAASLFVGADTPMGPFYLAYGRGSGGASAVYLFLGRP